MLLLTTCVLAALAAGARGEDLHTTLDDYHDVEAVVGDPASLTAFTLCFIGEGPCTELTESFRKNMPAAVPEACARCTTGQKHMFRVYLDGLESAAPELYARYAAFYDPAGAYLPALRKALAPF